MRNSHLFPSRSVTAALFCGLALAIFCARGISQDGIYFNTYREMSFTDVVTMVARQSGLRLVLQDTVDAVIEKLNFATPTPPEKIIESLANSQGLDFWKSGDTYFIGRRNTVAVTPVIDPLPTASAGTPFPSANPHPLVSATTAPAPPAPQKPASYMRKIELRHTVPSDMAWMLGAPSVNSPNAKRERTLKKRMETVLDPRISRINVDSGSNSVSPAFSSPWNTSSTPASGTVSRMGSATSGFQVRQPGGGVGGATGATGATGAAGATGATGAPGERTGLGGDLAAFLPDGIQDIVALVGLNALLVRATNEEALDSLELLIKMLDKPVKQVIVEAMIVKMDVVDARSMGVSFEWAGMPVSVTNLNPSGGGNFSVRYVSGNVRAALDTMITTSKARVVNAPRVIVQNGGSAEISMTDEVPFILISEDTDVFGRTTSTPTITMQSFDQSLSVEPTIHPDGYITLGVFPNLTAPGASVAIPQGSGAGSVAGASGMTVNTTLRIKNGETIMMGGFVNRVEMEGGTRTPLLSNLPVIGPLLFRNKSTNWNNSETLLFVTPTIMEEDTTSFEGMEVLAPIW